VLIALERLVLLIAWTAVAYAMAVFTARSLGHRWLYVPTFLVVFLAPAWDVVPGVIAYNAANASVGGEHVYRPGTAPGYLDRRVHSALAGWTELSLSPFEYIEIQSDEQPLTGRRDPGYYELRFTERAAVLCRQFEAMPGAASVGATLDKRDFCPSFVKRSQPISRYVVDSSNGWQPIRARWWSRPAQAKWTRVRDRELGVDLISNCIVRYRPWLATLGFYPIVPDWPAALDPTDDPPVNVSDVLDPLRGTSG
jgi:hypothetical protein